jgi:hypothetical protein
MTLRAHWESLTPNFPNNNVPIAAAAHDVLIAIAVGDSPDDVFTWDTGFTQVANLRITVDGGTLGVAIKPDATGSETSVAIQATNGNIITGVRAFSGRDNTTPQDITAVSALLNTNTASPWSLTSGAVVPANANDDIFIISMSDVSNLFTGAVSHSFSDSLSSTITKIGDFTDTGGGGRVWGDAWYNAPNTTSRTITATGTQSGESAGMALLVMALRAASGGGGGGGSAIIINPFF